MHPGHRILLSLFNSNTHSDQRWKRRLYHPLRRLFLSNWPRHNPSKWLLVSPTPPLPSPISPPPHPKPNSLLLSWIRAVESPNFHKYLQSRPLYSPGVAILDSYTTAGQFQIISGQLVQLINSTTMLYANVQQNTTVANKLSVSFNATKNVFGT